MKFPNDGFRQITTQELPGDLWWKAIHSIVQFLESVGVEFVNLEYGFVIDLNVAGKPHGENRQVPLSHLISEIEAGLKAGTIERGAGSDFVFRAVAVPLEVMLCNEGDIHLASNSPKILDHVREFLGRAGVQVNAVE